MLISAKTIPASNGITAQAEIAKTVVTNGASKKTALSALDGIITSFSTNFNRSANDYKRPNAPTTFGPRLICTAAHILRSANNKNAIVINSVVIKKTLFAAMIAAG